MKLIGRLALAAVVILFHSPAGASPASVPLKRIELKLEGLAGASIDGAKSRIEVAVPGQSGSFLKDGVPSWARVVAPISLPEDFSLIQVGATRGANQLDLPLTDSSEFSDQAMIVSFSGELTKSPVRVRLRLAQPVVLTSPECDAQGVDAEIEVSDGAADADPPLVQVHCSQESDGVNVELGLISTRSNWFLPGTWPGGIVSTAHKAVVRGPLKGVDTTGGDRFQARIAGASSRPEFDVRIVQRGKHTRRIGRAFLSARADFQVPYTSSFTGLLGWRPEFRVKEKFLIEPELSLALAPVRIISAPVLVTELGVTGSYFLHRRWSIGLGGGVQAWWAFGGFFPYFHARGMHRFERRPWRYLEGVSLDASVTLIPDFTALGATVSAVFSLP